MENEVVTRHPSPGAKLAEALSKAQGKIQPPLKTKNVDFTHNGKRTKYNYADLADVIEAIKGPFSENGLSIIHQLEFSPHGYGLKTILAHSSGEFIDTWYPLPDPSKQQIRAQEFGSALTYARRYSVSSLVGIASEEDDDGASTSPTDPPKPPTPPPRPQDATPPPRPATKVSDAQIKRLYSIATNAGWTKADVHDEIKKRWNYETTHDLDWKQYNILIPHIETHRFNKPPKPPLTPPADESFSGHPPDESGYETGGELFDEPPVTAVDQLVKYAAENGFDTGDVKTAIQEVTGTLKRASDMTDIEIQSVLRYLRILKNKRP